MTAVKAPMFSVVVLTVGQQPCSANTSACSFIAFASCAGFISAAFVFSDDGILGGPSRNCNLLGIIKAFGVIWALVYTLAPDLFGRWHGYKFGHCLIIIEVLVAQSNIFSNHAHRIAARPTHSYIRAHFHLGLIKKLY